VAAERDLHAAVWNVEPPEDEVCGGGVVEASGGELLGASGDDGGGGEGWGDAAAGDARGAYWGGEGASEGLFIGDELFEVESLWGGDEDAGGCERGRGAEPYEDIAGKGERRACGLREVDAGVLDGCDAHDGAKAFMKGEFWLRVKEPIGITWTEERQLATVSGGGFRERVFDSNHSVFERVIEIVWGRRAQR
jgi:hypothetical protein